MVIKLDVKLVGLDQLHIDMALIRSILGDLSEPLNESADHMMESIDKNFAQEGRPMKWKPLRQYTINDRIAEGFPGEHPILTRTHRLRDSITKRIWRNVAKVGTGLEKAFTLHHGGLADLEGVQVVIPARPFVMFNQEDPPAIKLIFEKHVNKALRL